MTNLTSRTSLHNQYHYSVYSISRNRPTYVYVRCRDVTSENRSYFRVVRDDSLLVDEPRVRFLAFDLLVPMSDVAEEDILNGEQKKG